jgi:regulator of sirC expression with transglutaminase-like and TPR domain
VTTLPAFTQLAETPDAPLDALAVTLAAEFHGVDAAAVMSELDALAVELAAAVEATDRTPLAEARACRELLGTVHGFTGDRDTYDDPRNSMLDIVLDRRRGLPILLSVIYVEVGRRAGVELEGIGLPGHFVVGHFGTVPPLLLDPFAGGTPMENDYDSSLTRPWPAHDIALRMLNNLVPAFARRGNVGAAIHAAELRLALPVPASHRETLTDELRALRARLN